MYYPFAPRVLYLKYDFGVPLCANGPFGRDGDRLALIRGIAHGHGHVRAGVGRRRQLESVNGGDFG